MKEKEKKNIADEIVGLIKGKKEKEEVIGLHENIVIKGSKKEKKVKAKVDTGATDSSISIRLFKEIGETPTIKEVLVERAHEEEKRPIVKLKIKYENSDWIESEFTVSHRENMEYEVLLGDNTLKKMHVLINPEED